MAYALVDDKLWAHAKTMPVSNAAMGLWVRGLSHAADQLTDGFVPHRVVLMFEGEAEAAELVHVGLWAACTERDGYIMHDYHDHNPTAASVRAKRKKVSEARAAAGRAGAAARWGK